LLSTRELEDVNDYLIQLSIILLNPTNSIESYLRSSAGLQIKNLLSSHDQSRQLEFNQRYNIQINQQTKIILKQNSIQTLEDQDKISRSISAQVIAAIASIELPQNQWNNLIQTLLQCIQNQQNTGLRQSSLQAIGFICESIVRFFINTSMTNY
jgi:importin subunit beta-1